MLKMYPPVGQRLTAIACAAWLSIASSAAAQTRDADAGLDHLRLLSGSIQALVKRVSPSVVQVVVTAYTAVEQGDDGQADLVMGKQRSIGSGVVVGADGYIMTNAHVVKGARSVQVILSAPSRTVTATIAGVAEEIDLALLKVDLTGLPALPLADYEQIRQGELVFAFGSPQGLRDSVTMGLVSATSRQPDPDAPMAYIQTDAAINRGNSGGPLVNANGELVGINTFILSNSGGSEGMGFAIPSSLVSMAYPKLRTFGHLHRGQTGMLLQTITPRSPQARARIGARRDRRRRRRRRMRGSRGTANRRRDRERRRTPVDSILPVAMRLFTSDGDERMNVGVIRNGRKLTFSVTSKQNRTTSIISRTC
jgi:serine protease Do